MKDGKHPNPNTIHPIAGYDKEIYVKPTITNPNIIVGDFTYIADSDFESHVSHLYEWNDDKLIIGKFCQIAAGVEFVMNGANHQMNAVSTFPFYTLEGWEMLPPAKTDMPLKGDKVFFCPWRCLPISMYVYAGTDGNRQNNLGNCYLSFAGYGCYHIAHSDEYYDGTPVQ